MKHKKYLYILFVSSFYLFFTSCNSALDQAPDGTISLDDVWKDNDKVAAYLNTCYQYMPPKGNQYSFWCRGPACWCDEAWDSNDLHGDVVSSYYYAGNASASNYPIWTMNSTASYNNNFWNNDFTSIHNCDYFLQHISKATVTNESDRSRWTAEAHLLRAYYYSELLKWFGCGLPLITVPYNYSDNFSKVKRASYYETAKFIIADCDTALQCQDLPWRITTNGEAGRLPKALAYAIISRVALYMASPLYCDNNNYWTEAYTLNKEALNGLEAQGYALYNTLYDNATYLGPDSYFAYDGYPNSLKEKAAIYNEYFTNTMEYSPNPRDRETIFQTNNGSQQSSNVEGIGAQFGIQSGACPSQELVDCFETTDGEPILSLSQPYADQETHLQPNYNPNNTLYNPQDPYKNRDPRFYAYIYYNGSQRKTWWPFAESSQSYENYPAPIGYRVRKIMTYIGEPMTGTADQGSTLTRTGYFLRKYIKPNTGSTNYVRMANYKDYRLAEVILNFAESAAHSGHEAEAIQAVNQIRERAGMPDLPSTLTGQDLLNRIILERRVELACEEARYFDVRRLHQPGEDLSTTDKWVTSAKIIRNADGTYTYGRMQVRTNSRLCYTNQWLKGPIPLGEINNILAITGDNWQNPGW